LCGTKRILDKHVRVPKKRNLLAKSKGHHIQKITAFLAAMADFSKYLERKGHKVCYLTLDSL
jgi:deoxyribodipyrimidine photolyase-like uncharacterized protein